MSEHQAPRFDRDPVLVQDDDRLAYKRYEFAYGKRGDGLRISAIEYKFAPAPPFYEVAFKRKGKVVAPPAQVAYWWTDRDSNVLESISLAQLTEMMRLLPVID